LSEISPREAAPIKNHLDNQTLLALKPLGQSSPLAQESDFQLSPLVTEFSAHTSNISQEIPILSEHSTIQRVQLTPENLATPEPPAAKIEDIADSWSNISELLGENPSPAPDINRFAEDEFALTSPFLNLPNAPLSNSVDSPNSPSYSIPTSGDLTKTCQSLKADAASKYFYVDDQQLEILAQQVYILLRQRLEIEQERRGIKCTGNSLRLGYFTTTYGNYAQFNPIYNQSNYEIDTVFTVKDLSEIDLLDNQLNILTNEIQIIMRQRLEIDQERQGSYYAGYPP
jgi:hypothetical protein